ncbi:MAG: LamG domain-containing protein, partial [Muribaculaceae bacterium]|nr:LamG domain-containing protein [Muribaculaceae bacterium]
MISTFLNKRILSGAIAGVLYLPMLAGVQVHIPMEIDGGMISDVISGAAGEVKGVFAPETVPGAVGNAVLFDGYSTRADVTLNNIFPQSAQDMTFSLRMAVPCYPIVEIDKHTGEKATVVSCTDADAKKGFGLYLGMDGKLEFILFAGGWQISVESDRPIAPYEWNNVAAVLNHADHTLALYINGEKVGSQRCNGAAEPFSGTLRFGYGLTDRLSGPFYQMAINGIIH